MMKVCRLDMSSMLKDCGLVSNVKYFWLDIPRIISSIYVLSAMRTAGSWSDFIHNWRSNRWGEMMIFNQLMIFPPAFSLYQFSSFYVTRSGWWVSDWVISKKAVNRFYEKYYIKYPHMSAKFQDCISIRGVIKVT